MRIRPVDPERCVTSESIKHSRQGKKDHTKKKEKIRIQHIELIKKNSNIKKVLCIGPRDDSDD